MKILIINEQYLIEMVENGDIFQPSSFIKNFTLPESIIKNNLKSSKYTVLSLDKKRIELEISRLKSILNNKISDNNEYEIMKRDIENKLNIYELIRKEAIEIEY